MSSTGIYDAIVGQAAVNYGVPVEWIKAVIGAETSFESPAPKRWEPKVKEYAWGPMQILLSTARGLGFTGTGAELAEPLNNIAIGTAYLSQLRGRFGNDFRRVYSAYNSGRPDTWTISSQVRANVERATGWLQTFGGTVVAEENGFAIVILMAAAGVWWWTSKKKGVRPYAAV